MGISLSCPAQVGKWHADVNSYNHGFEYGRAVLFRPMGSTHFARAKASNESFGPLPLVDVDPGKKFRASKFKKVGQEAAVLRACTPRSRFLPRCHSSALFAEAGSRELARWRRSRLTGFLYVALTAPHDPLEPLDRDVADATAGPPASFRDRHVFSLPRVARVVAADALRADVDAAAPSAPGAAEALVGSRDELLLPFPRRAADLEARRRLYGGLVASVDAAVAALDAASRPDRILVVTSDHGIALDGRHGLIGKQNLYEHSNKVPLLVHGCGPLAAGGAKAHVYLHDVAPTLIALSRSRAPPFTAPIGEQRKYEVTKDSAAARARATGPCAGRDFSALFARENGTFAPRAHLFAAMIDTQRMVVDTATNLKVIAHFNASLKGRGDTRGAELIAVQAFDVARDPDELDDLVLRDFESNAAAAAHYAPRLPAAGDDGDAVGALLREACELERKLRKASATPEKNPPYGCLGLAAAAAARRARDDRRAEDEKLRSSNATVAKAAAAARTSIASRQAALREIRRRKPGAAGRLGAKAAPVRGLAAKDAAARKRAQDGLRRRRHAAAVGGAARDARAGRGLRFAPRPR